MPWGATTFGRVNQIAFANSPYQASPGEIIECDCVGGAITVLAPPFTTPGKTFTVKKIDQSTNIVTVTASAIEALVLDKVDTQAVLYSEMACATWYDSGNVWVGHSTFKIPKWVEVYSATPVTVGGLTTLQWTHLELYPGQPEFLFTQAAGVFTVVETALIRVEIQVLWGLDISSNNFDATGTIDLTFSGAGQNTYVPGWKTFGHSRSGVYPMSDVMFGSVNGATSDTLTFVANDGAGQLGTTDLVEAFLTVGTG